MNVSAETAELFRVVWSYDIETSTLDVNTTYQINKITDAILATVVPGSQQLWAHVAASSTNNIVICLAVLMAFAITKKSNEIIKRRLANALRKAVNYLERDSGKSDTATARVSFLNQLYAVVAGKRIKSLLKMSNRNKDTSKVAIKMQQMLDRIYAVPRLEQRQLYMCERALQKNASHRTNGEREFLDAMSDFFETGDPPFTIAENKIWTMLKQRDSNRSK